MVLIQATETIYAERILIAVAALLRGDEEPGYTFHVARAHAMACLLSEITPPGRTMGTYTNALIEEINAYLDDREREAWRTVGSIARRVADDIEMLFGV